jgi:parvulin-like peptidyl-prolyl isomerase
MAPKPKIQSKKHIARLERERRQTKLIQYVAIAVVTIVILLVGYGYLDIAVLQKLQPVAEVNGEKITTKEFQARVTVQRNQLLNQYMQFLQYQQVFGMDVSSQLQQIESSLNTPTIVGQQVMDEMIQDVLIRQEAKKRGISVSAEEIEAFKKEQFQFFPDGTPTPTVTPTQVEVTYPTLSATQLGLVTLTPVPTKGPTSTPFPTPTVDPAFTPEATSTPAPTPLPSATLTPYTLEGYQNTYATAQAGFMETGYTRAQYETIFETELLRKKLFEAVTADMKSEQEQVWARHILVATEEEAKAVIERLNKGEEFGALAAELSIDTGSGAKGGDLGWFGKGAMVAPFEEAAFQLQVGEISEPVQSEFGWHIIQILDRATLPLTASELQQARQSAFDEFLTKLRDESEVTIYDYWTERVPTTPGLEALQGLQQ